MTFIVLGLLLCCVGITCIAILDLNVAEIELSFTFVLLFINFLMALMIFIYGGGVTGFYIIATLGMNCIVLPKKALFEQ